jgi:hypothetical protein
MPTRRSIVLGTSCTASNRAVSSGTPSTLMR